MQNANATLPTYKRLVLENDLSAVASMDLDDVSREKVFQMSSLLACVTDAGWVGLIAGWGFDLNSPALNSFSGSSRNWLWNALKQGKTKQALALVRAGFIAIDVDEMGRSGLGSLIEETHHDGLATLLDMLVQFDDIGMAWQNWPDALDFDAIMRKNVGLSLGEMLASRSSCLLVENTPPAAAHGAPVRL